MYRVMGLAPAHRQSRAVTTVTVMWMSHGSHEPDGVPTRMSQGWNMPSPGHLAPVPRLQANLAHPLRAGSACGAPLLAWNQMRGPEQRSGAP